MPPLISENWPILLPTALGMLAIYLLLPRASRFPPLYGAVVAGLAIFAAGTLLIQADWPIVETVLFYIFSGLAVLFGGLMIIQRNPVHSALSFAMVVLSTCGLVPFAGSAVFDGGHHHHLCGGHRGDISLRHHARPASRPVQRRPALA